MLSVNRHSLPIRNIYLVLGVLEMTITYSDSKMHFESVNSVLDALVRSASLPEFCRAIVHSDFTQNHVQGCQIFSLTPDSKLIEISGYGLRHLNPETSLTAWDNDPISLCIRSKDYELAPAADETNNGVLAIPLLKEGIPIGALALVLEPKGKALPIHERLIPILGKLGTYCLNAFPATSNRSHPGLHSTSEQNGEDLSSRQIKILELMADGKVNVEIARELMLSESTIRQETVRIYRSLGVPNRADASKKGRALGLIKRTAS